MPPQTVTGIALFSTFSHSLVKKEVYPRNMNFQYSASCTIHILKNAVFWDVTRRDSIISLLVTANIPSTPILVIDNGGDMFL
jgi:hypothetical protein